MCGSNTTLKLKPVNGVDVGTAAHDGGGVPLQVNWGDYTSEGSNLAIVEVVVSNWGLTSTKVYAASDYLMLKLLQRVSGCMAC